MSAFTYLAQAGTSYREFQGPKAEIGSGSFCGSGITVQLGGNRRADGQATKRQGGRHQLANVTRTHPILSMYLSTSGKDWGRHCSGTGIPASGLWLPCYGKYIQARALYPGTLALR